MLVLERGSMGSGTAPGSRRSERPVSRTKAAAWARASGRSPSASASRSASAASPESRRLAQQRDRVGAGQRPDLHRAGPAGCQSGFREVISTWPVRRPRQVGLDVLAPLGVVEDQQPAGVRLQPAADGGDADVWSGSAGLGQAERRGPGRRRPAASAAGSRRPARGRRRSRRRGDGRTRRPAGSCRPRPGRGRSPAGSAPSCPRRPARRHRGQLGRPADEVGVGAARDHPDRIAAGGHRRYAPGPVAGPAQVPGITG